MTDRPARVMPPKQRLRTVPPEDMEGEIVELVRCMLRERGGVLEAMRVSGWGELVITLPMRDWEWGHYGLSVGMTGVVQADEPRDRDGVGPAAQDRRWRRRSGSAA